MPSIGSSFLFLGLLVTSVTAEEMSPLGENSSLSMVYNNSDFDNKSMTAMPSMTTATNLTGTMMSTTTADPNITNANSSITPSTTTPKGNDRTATKMHSTTSKSTTLFTKNKVKDISTTVQALPQADDRTGIIILIVIILVALVFGVACFVARKRGRRYSVDFTSRQDDANIPLSTVEPELPIDSVPQNGLQTFESTDTATQEPQEPESKPEAEGQKAEDQSAVGPSAESAAPASPPDSPEDKPKEDAVEQGPPPPVELSVEEKTDDEGIVSNKTSVESLKETNENNSNNADSSQQRDLKFWDVPLDCSV